jgi:hypothetical protein
MAEEPSGSPDVGFKFIPPDTLSGRNMARQKHGAAFMLRHAF